MSFYGLHASDKFAHQTGAQAAGLPQALWYFRNEWIAVPAGEPRDFRFCPDFQVDRDWQVASKEYAAAGAEAALPLLVWVAAPACLEGACLDATATALAVAVAVAGARFSCTLVPRLPLNGAWFNADSAAFFSSRSLRLRGTRDAASFVVRSFWPEDYALPEHAAPLPAIASAADLRTWVRGDRLQFSVASLWQKTPTQSIAAGTPVLGLMLNGAQGDDDEAHGGHFALLTGRVGEGGSIADLLVYNFYALDSES